MTRHCLREITVLVLMTLIVSPLIFRQPIFAADPDHPTAVREDKVAVSLSQAFRSAAARASPGLVRVYTLRGPRMTPSWRRHLAATTNRIPANFHGSTPSSSLTASPDEQGSGIVIDSQGFILTCQHVIDAADVVFVVLADGRRFEADRVWGDPATDLAMLQIKDAGDLHEVSFADSDELKAGDFVVSLANPYDMEHSISAGIVSDARRWIAGVPYPQIQNDAATNPGSSGGALINLQGEVVGIITGAYSTRREFQGIGLAIPVNVANRVAKELRTKGTIERGYLGCASQRLSPKVAKLLELPVPGGLYVKNVDPASPAADAGFKVGDVITHVDSEAIDEAFRADQLYLKPRAGEKHTYTLFRNSRSIAVEVELDKFPNHDLPSHDVPAGSFGREPAHFDKRLGLGLDDLTGQAVRELDLPPDTQGALITKVAPGSIAYKEGIAAGMAVVRLGDLPISNIDDFKRALRRQEAHKPIVVLLQSSDQQYLAVIER